MHNSTTVPNAVSFDGIGISEFISVWVSPPQNPLVDLLREEKVWLTWTRQLSKDGKPTKVPTKIKNGRGLPFNATLIAELGTYNEVAPLSSAVAQHGIDGVGGIGVSVRHLSTIELVDLDHCVHDGVITNPLVKRFVEAAATYVEYSPSGTGLRPMFQVTDGKPVGFKRHIPDDARDDVQIQTNCTYYTVTGRIFLNVPVRTITKRELAALYALVGVTKETESPLAPPERKDERDESPVQDDADLILEASTESGGDKFMALYNGDTSGHNGDDSRADLALCRCLAYWTDKDAERMDRIFRTSKLMRPKWDEPRPDTDTRAPSTYGRNTVKKAIQDCAQTRSQRGKKLDFLMSGGKDPKPLVVLENICRVLERDDHFQGVLRLNEFSSMTEMRDEGTNAWVLLGDSFILDAIRYVSTKYSWCFANVGKDMMTNAILAVASKTKVNPPKDYLLSLRWDGVPRLDTWLQHAYGAPDDTIHREIGANWMKGLVLRVMRPGCQYDHVLVLESEQGWGKSQSLRVLGAPWHVEITQSPDNKDFFMILAQNMIVEFSEGDMVSRTDVKKLKGIITMRETQVRLPYARGISTLKRGCVFAMTTNDTEYLKDETGNRRWLPVKLAREADIEWIRTNRDQLYAEAYHRAIVKGEPAHVYTEKELLKEMQESRREHNDYEENIIFWYRGLTQGRRDYGIQIQDVYKEVILRDADLTGRVYEIPKLVQLQIAGMLKGALCLENKDVKRDRVVLKRWLPTEQTYARIGIEKPSPTKKSESQEKLDF